MNGIEFMPWYHPGSDMVRCSGDKGCGNLLIEGDMELHTKWHQKIEDLHTPPSPLVSVPLKRKV